MHRVFIADLHLSPGLCENSRILINFLEENHASINELYILGDLFNFWVGDDIHLDEYRDVINAFAKFNQNKSRTFLQYGNRDFLFTNNFFDKTNITWIDDPYFIFINHNKTILTHGDLMFDTSFSYQLYRRLCLFLNKSNLIRNTFFKLSKKFRIGIANKLRRHGKDYVHFEIDLDDHNQFIKKMTNLDAKILIHGHTHIPSIQLLKVNDRFLKRYTLSDWHGQGCILVAKDEQPLKMKYI